MFSGFFASSKAVHFVASLLANASSLNRRGVGIDSIRRSIRGMGFNTLFRRSCKDSTSSIRSVLKLLDVAVRPSEEESQGCNGLIMVVSGGESYPRTHTKKQMKPKFGTSFRPEHWKTC